MKETKQLKPSQTPKQLPTCKHKVEKKQQHKTPPNHNSLIDYCLQQGVDDYSHKSTEQK